MRKPVENRKVSDAAMTKFLAISVICILICMSCLVGTTWAWYSSSVTSAPNETIGGNFDFSIVISETIEPDENGIYTFNGGEHTVTLTSIGMCDSGFCQVIAKKEGAIGATTYYYALSKDKPVSFSVTGLGTLKFMPIRSTTPLEELSNPSDGISLTLTMMPPQDLKEIPNDKETLLEEVEESVESDNTIESKKEIVEEG